MKTGWYRDGCVVFNGYSQHTNSKGNTRKRYDGDVDYFLVYCYELETIYLVAEDEVETQLRLRVEDPDQRQPSINWAADYAFDAQWPPGSADAASVEETA